jgi:hydroxyacylglutathione hydrolase
MNLLPLPAFTDNYIWMLHDARQAIVVDPGDATPVLQTLQAQGLQLQAILVTHHHADHVGGVDALRAATGAQVFGPARERIPEPLVRLAQGDTVEVLGLRFSVLDVPGHTAGHIAYYCPDMQGAPLLFCGDTLFSGGCGRLFEGTPAQMLASLDQLAALPGDTRVCCAHEYTLSNLRFARAVEPGNQALLHYSSHCESLRARQLPTLPSRMALERDINPFLRVRETAVAAAAQGFDARVPQRRRGGVCRPAPMEKRLLMKILHFACLAGLLWLTGCATNGTPGTSGNGPFNNESSSRRYQPHPRHPQRAFEPHHGRPGRRQRSGVAVHPRRPVGPHPPRLCHARPAARTGAGPRAVVCQPPRLHAAHDRALQQIPVPHR